MIKRKILSLCFFVTFNMFPSNAHAFNFETGKNLFKNNCLACHENGKNLSIPEKNLKKEILQANGMYNVNAIKYQILNGKNGMPAFGGRLKEKEIEEISNYVIKAAEQNFEL